MMRGRLFIDGADAFDTCGVFITEGGLADLVSLPAFKEVAVNEWAEERGEEPDLSAPVLQGRTVNVTFAARTLEGAQAFLDLLSDGVYHSFNVASLGRTFTLRLTAMPSLVTRQDLGLFSLRFADDFPPVVLPGGADEAEYRGLYGENTLFLSQTPPGADGIHEQYLTIDGTDLSEFGIHLIEGSAESIRRAPEVRLALSRSSGYIAGTSYDKAAVVRYRAKDVTLRLFIHSKSGADFWTRWDALHTVLLKNGERDVAYKGDSHKAYYKGSKVTAMMPDGNDGLWCEFQTTLRYVD